MPRRRQRGEGALYQRASDRMWIGVVDLGYLGGKRNRVTVSAKTQRAAARKLSDLKDELSQSGGQAPQRLMTVGQWMTYWLDEIAPKKPTTAKFYRTSAAHVIDAIGRTRLDKLTTAHVRQMHKAVLAKTWRGQPLSTTTAMHAHGTLVTALEAARREGYVGRNVAELVDPPSRRRSGRGALTASQARTVLSTTADDRLSSRWMMALLTGARQGECLGLRWQHIDLDRRQIDLAWQLQRVGLRHGCADVAACTEPHHRRPCPADCPKAKRTAGRPHKCITADDPRLCPTDCRKHVRSCPGKEPDVPRDFDHIQLFGGMCLVPPKTTAGIRVVPMPDALLSSLLARKAAYLSERHAYEVDHDLVWPRLNGQPIDAGDDDRAWHDALAAAGVPDVELHAARHTTSTLLLEAGVDVKVIEQIVGHSSAVTTRGYQHVSLELARRALDALEQRIQLEP